MGQFNESDNDALSLRLRQEAVVNESRRVGQGSGCSSGEELIRSGNRVYIYTMHLTFTYTSLRVRWGKLSIF